ncbi:MAG TPA: tetratricopeptide repeat-containing glycosyltransferase family protein [Patescibacteria group bacterium]|nr:tetratricopeptide repeat-containing glycosyltransferase family protein [Patescibacteria group bacterium]
MKEINNDGNAIPVDVIYARARKLHEKGNLTAAEDQYRLLLKHCPDHAGALRWLGIIAYQAGHWEAATSLLEAAREQEPELVNIHGHLAMVYSAQENFERAIEMFRQELARHPEDSITYYNMGNLFKRQENTTAAEKYYWQALELNENFIAAYNNLGHMLLQDARPAKALAVMNRGMVYEPEYAPLRFNRSQALLLAGQLEEGFREYRWRKMEEDWLQQSFKQRLSQRPLWQGEGFSGRRLLIVCEQGFGDSLQFVRFVPQVKERGGLVTLWAQPQLRRLFASLAGVDDLSGGHPDELDLNAYDLVVPLLDLPGIFGVTLNSVPKRIPYLQSDPELVRFWTEKLRQSGSPDGRLRIGLVWAGNTYGGRHSVRSAALADYGPLVLPEISAQRRPVFFSLQKGAGSEEVAYPPAGMEIYDLTAAIDDFADTAALIMNLDLVITIDTSVAHLAGALGKPVWVLLPYGNEWRWLTGRETSPWYPAMRLFRQERKKDWPSVVAKVADSLTERIK